MLLAVVEIVDLGYRVRLDEKKDYLASLGSLEACLRLWKMTSLAARQQRVAAINVSAGAIA
jgi:hypothetical protein